MSKAALSSCDTSGVSQMINNILKMFMKQSEQRSKHVISFNVQIPSNANHTSSVVSLARRSGAGVPVTASVLCSWSISAVCQRSREHHREYPYNSHTRSRSATRQVAPSYLELEIYNGSKSCWCYRPVARDIWYLSSHFWVECALKISAAFVPETAVLKFSSSKFALEGT